MPDAPRLDDLIATVHERAPDDAIEQLRTAASLKAELDDLTDALLGHFVDQARRAGGSWSQIGEALGVSKQAAQQRHTTMDATAKRLLGALAPRWAGGAGFLGRFTTRARAVVVHAETAARGFNHPFVGTEHMLLGLYGEPEGIAAKVLDELGVDRAGLVADVLEKVPMGDEPVEGPIPFTPRAKALLDRAMRAALELGHDDIGTEHMLLGLLDEDGGIGGHILRGRGVERDPTKAAIVRHLPPLGGNG